MSKFLGFSVFLLTFMIGISLNSQLISKSWFHHECSRYANIDQSARYFNLAEGKQRIGRRIRYVHQSAFPHNSGRVVSLDLIEKDKFLIVVYWEVTPDNGNFGLRYYSRDYYENNLVEEKN